MFRRSRKCGDGVVGPARRDRRSVEMRLALSPSQTNADETRRASYHSLSTMRYIWYVVWWLTAARADYRKSRSDILDADKELCAQYHIQTNRTRLRNDVIAERLAKPTALRVTKLAKSAISRTSIKVVDWRWLGQIQETDEKTCGETGELEYDAETRIHELEGQAHDLKPRPVRHGIY